MLRTTRDVRLTQIVFTQQVSVYPREVQLENPNSYRARKRESFRLQRERRKARREGNFVEPQLVLASANEGEENNLIC